MDVASPLTARSAARSNLGSVDRPLFTLARKFIALATIPFEGTWRPWLAASDPDSHHPPAAGSGQPVP